MKKWIETYINSISEIIENLDNSICSHKLGFKHYTRGCIRGTDYVGGDIWEVYCVRCGFVKEQYAVRYPHKVDWNRIDKMKKL